MKSFKTTILAAIALATVNITYAQTIDEVQAKYIDALGGKDKLNSLKSLYQEASTEVMGMTLDSKVWIIFGTAMRSEVDVQGQKIVTYMTKDKGWMINPMMGSTDAQPMPDDAIKAQSGRLSAGGDFYKYKENGYTGTLQGKEDIDGKSNFKVNLKKEGQDITYYIDASTYYLTRILAKVTMSGQDIEQVVNFADYQKTPDGYVFPHKSTTNNPQAGDIVNTITKIEVNKALDPKDLEKTN
ncbi:MAG: hypothetical protein C5B52_06745 [Bacteroidetes bacterium]|nr:MAG: hypothetical protein C5B52_06745 [Bacteroidota bacterium]